MAYPKINRLRKYKKKKHHPLATACITILFCIGISLGLAAFWQKYDKNLTGPSKEESSIASEPLSSSQPQSRIDSSSAPAPSSR